MRVEGWVPPAFYLGLPKRDSSKDRPQTAEPRWNAGADPHPLVQRTQRGGSLPAINLTVTNSRCRATVGNQGTRPAEIHPNRPREAHRTSEAASKHPAKRTANNGMRIRASCANCAGASARHTQYSRPWVNQARVSPFQELAGGHEWDRLRRSEICGCDRSGRKRPERQHSTSDAVTVAARTATPNGGAAGLDPDRPRV